MLKIIGYTLAGIAAILLFAATPFLWSWLTAPQQGAAAAYLPWQIETSADGGSTVFGLTFGENTLAQARQQFGRDCDIAIVAPPGEPPLLEVYFESMRTGYITGKLIVTAKRDDAIIKGMQERAVKVEYMESVTRKYTLGADDLPSAWAMPIDAITFIPTANLDENIILHQFGEPAMRIRSSDELEHFLYPDKGLDLALDTRKKEVLQYVAPRDFERLRAPLLAADDNAPEEQNSEE